MANRNTRIRGIQIKDGDVGADQLAQGIKDSLALADSAVQPGDLPTFGDIVTHDADEFATTGALAGLYTKPTGGIPASDLADTYLTSSDISGLYTKPGTGIPSSDMTQAVQDSLALADTALQVGDGVGMLESAVKVEDLTGNADTSLTLANAPVAGSFQLFINGLLQEEGTGKDYTISGTAVTLAVASVADDIIIAHYIDAV